MPRHLTVAFTLALAVSAACFTGPSAGGFPPAVTGHGVNARLRLGNRRIDGELLQLRDTAYVLINKDGILIIPFVAVEDAHFEGFGSVGGGEPEIQWRDQLRLASRFPHGMSPAVLAELLASAGQSEMKYVR